MIAVAAGGAVAAAVCVAGGDGVAGGATAVVEVGGIVAVALGAAVVSAPPGAAMESPGADGCRLHAASKRQTVAMRSALALTARLLCFLLSRTQEGKLHGDAYNEEDEKNDNRNRWRKS